MNHTLKRSLFLMTEVAAAACLLAACGGGGDGGSVLAEAQSGEATSAASGETAATPSTETSDAAPDAAAADAATADAATADTATADTATADVAGEPDPASIAAGETDVRWAGVIDAPLAPDSVGHLDGPISSDGETPAAADAAPDAEVAAAAAEAAQRESAQAIAHATPKVAGLDYTQSSSTERIALLAKHKLVLIGLGRDKSATFIQNIVNGVRSRNPSVKIGNYVLINELQCSASSGTSMYPLVQAANSTSWWLRTSSGSRTQWTTNYNACDMNVTSWGRKNSAGQSWTQYKWSRDYNSFFRIASFNYVFIDNFWGKPRTTADWRRIGTNQSSSDPTIQAAFRSGMSNYVRSVRSTNSSLKVMGNSDYELNKPEHAELLDGAFLEGSMGKSWSRETWAGWKSTMDYYRAAMRNTRAPNDVIFQVFGSHTDYKMMRYGLASAMMDNGYFMYLPLVKPSYPKWFDEFSAPIGTPIDAPPTAPAQNGIYKRRYTNGIVLVNPSKTTTASINIGSGYKRLKGTQDPTVNNGASQSTVRLGPRQGLLMIKS
jgi:hypothetical protein